MFQTQGDETCVSKFKKKHKNRTQKEECKYLHYDWNLTIYKPYSDWHCEYDNIHLQKWKGTVRSMQVQFPYNETLFNHIKRIQVEYKKKFWNV